MREELIKDLDNMEQILTKTANRCDIWQDRFVHAMAKALYHILTWIIRMEETKKMRGDLEYYDPDVCDGDFCPLNCEHCPKADLVIQKQEEKEETAGV